MNTEPQEWEGGGGEKGAKNSLRHGNNKMINSCLGDRHREREEKMGAGKAVFHKDQKQRKTKYKKFTDDGVKKLHEARHNRLPTGDPSDWADQVPVKREQTMKNLYMTHYGLGQGQVDTKTIVKLHDRRVAVELDELCRGSSLRTGGDAAEVWKLKEGAFNYINIMHKLWPTDPAAQIIYRVLEEYRWGMIAGDDKKLRANMVRRFFNEATEENAGRAVIRGLCLTFEEGRAKWLRMVEREFPQTAGMSSGARTGTAGGRSSGQSGKKPGAGAGASTYGNAGGGGGGGGPHNSAAKTGGGAGGGGARASGQTFTTPIPRFNGLSLCWSFNKGGCTRPALTATTCKEHNSASIFAHVCNYWDPIAKAHCYGAHWCKEPGRH